MSVYTEAVLGGVEAGGTKTLCAVASPDGQIIDKVRFPTRAPNLTIDDITSFFRKYAALKAIGLGCFGPIDLDPSSLSQGVIGLTPKPGWSRLPLLEILNSELELPLSLMTDVETAALAEFRAGAGQGCQHLVYITIGTGIGCGIISDGKVWRGRRHSEVGHYFPQIHPYDQTFEGICPYHKNCIEGLASGPSIKARTGLIGQDLEVGHPAWDAISDYIAQLCIMVSAVVAPDRIILGGGVMSSDGLLLRVRDKFLSQNRDYHDALGDMGVHNYIVRPSLENDPGLIGAIMLAGDSLKMDWRPNGGPID